MLFESEKNALNFIKFNADEIREENGKAPERAYYCDVCIGWHVTSMENFDTASSYELIKQKVADNSEDELERIIQQMNECYRNGLYEEFVKKFSKAITLIRRKKFLFEGDNLLTQNYGNLEISLSVLFEKLKQAEGQKEHPTQLKNLSKLFNDLYCRSLNYSVPLANIVAKHKKPFDEYRKAILHPEIK